MEEGPTSQGHGGSRTWKRQEDMLPRDPRKSSPDKPFWTADFYNCEKIKVLQRPQTVVLS